MDRHPRQTGVYVLTGPDPEGPRSQRIYIGEADSLKSRLDSHQKEKDFWTQGFLLTTKVDRPGKGSRQRHIGQWNCASPIISKRA
ncbi:MAG: GIY-YIG nuclease family protein [Thermoleophilia bacterium]|nr:GIY-YIG nuclease family protein [Thermoleophilia bacterium]